MTRRRLAVIGFGGHVPGLWLFARHSPCSAVARLNLMALLVTAVAMWHAGRRAGRRGVFVAWLSGHFAWSTFLATRLLRGRPDANRSR